MPTGSSEANDQYSTGTIACLSALIIHEDKFIVDTR